MIGIFSGLKMAFFGVIAAAVIGGWLYVKGLQKDLAVAKENMIKLEGAVSEQKRVIEQQRIDFEAIVEANKKIVEHNKKLEKEYGQLDKKFNKINASGKKRDLGALAEAGDNLCGNGTAMTINGKSMDMNRIDETVRKGDTEIWRITVDDWRHPFHIHGCSFRILSQEGETPPAYAQGWKDMVHVDGDVWSEILVRFDYSAPNNSPYMYHCHILEHEDCGMMGQFTVT